MLWMIKRRHREVEKVSQRLEIVNSHQHNLTLVQQLLAVINGVPSTNA